MVKVFLDAPTMAELLSEQELRKKASEALAEKLGPVEALRFLALISREPFDCQQWRKEYFSGYSVDQLIAEVQAQHRGESHSLGSAVTSTTARAATLQRRYPDLSVEVDRRFQVFTGIEMIGGSVRVTCPAV